MARLRGRPAAAAFPWDAGLAPGAAARLNSIAMMFNASGGAIPICPPAWRAIMKPKQEPPPWWFLPALLGGMAGAVGLAVSIIVAVG